VTCEKRLLAEHVEFVKEKKMNVLGTQRRHENDDVYLNDSVIVLKRIALEFSSLPFDCVETTSVDVKFDTASSQLFSCLDGDMVVAPRVIAADQVFVRKLPQRARPGTAFYFELVFRDTNPSTWSTQLVSSLALHAHVDVVLHAASASNATLIPLVATFTPLRSPASSLSSLSSLSPDASFGVTVCIAIPDQGQEEQEQEQGQEQEPLDRRLSINRITIAGQSLQHQADVTFPVSFRVRQGMFAPQTIPATQYMMWTTPAIALDATLYVATWKSPIVSCFTGDGVALEPLLLSSVGLSPLCTHAALDASSNTLLLADCNKLVAINTSSRTTLWQHACNIFEITVLRHGIVLVSSSQQVTALRLCDGAFLSRTELVGCALHITSDAATAIVYITIRGTCPSVQHSISAYKWDAEHNALVFVAHATTFTEPLSFRATTVVHVPRHSRSFLVGTYNTNTLHVFSLPDHRLIHVYSHPNMIMRGLAADPSGTAIAVCDGASDTVQVLPWPLPGMLMPVL
jgi:hypothetical protein